MTPKSAHFHLEPRDHRVLRVKSRLRLELEQSGLSQKAVAIDLGIDHALLSRWLQDQCRDLPGPHHVIGWTTHVGPGFAAWQAQQSGHALVADGDIGPPATLADAGTLAALAGHTVQVLIGQFTDGHWDELEKRHALPDLRRLQALVDRLVLEAGVIA